MKRTVLKLLLVFLITYPVFSQEIEPKKSQCSVQPEKLRVYLQNFIGNKNFKLTPSRYVDFFSYKRNIVIDVRDKYEGGENKEAKPVVQRALSIPLYSLKTKRYLKEKSIVLVGDGLDYAELESVVDDLEFSGFKNVKILRHGYFSLIDTVFLEGGKEKDYPSLRHVDARKVVTSSLQDKDNFLFINLSAPSEIYEHLGVKSINIEYSDSKQFFAKLYLAVKKQFSQNDYTRIVIVHDDDKVYRAMQDSKYMFSAKSLMYSKGGVAAMKAVEAKMAKLELQSKRGVRRCEG